jgi:hypothetical protein
MLTNDIIMNSPVIFQNTAFTILSREELLYTIAMAMVMLPIIGNILRLYF